MKPGVKRGLLIGGGVVILAAIVIANGAMGARLSHGVARLAHDLLVIYG